MAKNTPNDPHRAAELAKSLNLYHHDRPATRAFCRTLLFAGFIALLFTVFGFVLSPNTAGMNVFSGCLMGVAIIAAILVGGGGDEDSDFWPWIDFGTMRHEWQARKADTARINQPITPEQRDFVVAYAQAVRHLKGRERRQMRRLATPHFEELGSPDGNKNEHAQ